MKKIMITGFAGKDAESRATTDGKIFTTFSVGVTVGTKENPKTDWVEVTCNGKLAEIALMYVKKGIRILAEGFPTVNAYINKENKAIGTLVIYANNIEFLSDKKKEEANTTNNSQYETLPPLNSGDDIPF